jgi:HNH endonuclease
MKWTKKEERVMRKHYRATGWEELYCLLPGRTQRAIYQRGKFMGIERMNPGGFQPGSKAGSMYRFPKGQTPWNKGKRGYMGANETSFKPGSIPPQSKPFGALYIRKDKGVQLWYAKAEGNKVRPLHYLLYEKEHGAIPKGHILRFKDGNTLNPLSENLECISRAENLKRNSIHRYKEANPDLYKATYALIGLKQAITARAK